MINLFWSIPHRFFHNAIAWPELNFIFKEAFTDDLYNQYLLKQQCTWRTMVLVNSSISLLVFYLFKFLQEFFEGEVNYDGLDTPLGVAL